MKIKWKLFFIYSSLILLILLVSSAVFYHYSTGLMRDNGYQALYQTSVAISDKLDSEMENLDQLATRIIFSDQVSDIWFHSITFGDGTLNQTSINRLNSAVYSLAGPNLQDWEISLYHLDGRIASMGMYSAVNLEDKETIHNFPLVSQSLKAQGSKILSGPYVNPWNCQDKVISVSRCFGSDLISPQNAVVEVSMEYEHLLRGLKKIVRSANHGDSISFQILRSDGTTLYSQDDTFSESISQYLDKSNSSGENCFSFRNSSTEDKIAASYVHSDYTDWIIITSLPEPVLFETVNSFGKWLIIISIFALICTTLVSYLAANNLTKPLEKMHLAIENTSLPYALPVPETDYRRLSEPEALYSAYMHLTRQLESSIERSAQMQIRETQARLSALQSQMNPHFLYNTLSSISILTETGEQEKVIKICRLLTDMMGYILSKQKKEATLADEILLAEHYLELMKIRYEHYLEWDIHIPQAMHSLPFPKLILQPLVENCMKYATGGTPPWQIHVCGFLEEPNSWRIRITDNGLGFSKEYLDFWNQSGNDAIPRYYDETSDGLGIKNTRARLQILYPQGNLFELSNLPNGGACILFGGTFPNT